MRSCSIYPPRPAIKTDRVAARPAATFIRILITCCLQHSSPLVSSLCSLHCAVLSSLRCTLNPVIFSLPRTRTGQKLEGHSVERILATKEKQLQTRWSGIEIQEPEYDPDCSHNLNGSSLCLLSSVRKISSTFYCKVLGYLLTYKQTGTQTDPVA